MQNTDPARLAKWGITPSEFLLLARWYFLDSNITTQALESIYALQPAADPSLSLQLGVMHSALQTFFAEQPTFGYLLSALLLLSGLCFALGLRKRSQHPFVAPAVVANLLLGAGQLGYLAYQGRLPMRAAVSIVFPMAVFLMMLCFPCFARETALEERPSLRKRVNPLALAALAACLALTVVPTVETFQLMNRPTDPEAKARMDEIPISLDAFAVAHPEVLIICDMSTLLDNRLFPDLSAGVPQNILFWGGYAARSPSWRYQLQSYGLDPDAFTARDFFRENVVVASALGVPDSALVQHIQESSEYDVDWEYYAEDGYISYFQFYEY